MSHEMPRRPMQHDVETASRRAFEAVLPDNWTAQERRHDYGIDFDVEIFTDGEATGLTFGVQVKGTKGLTSRPSSRVKWSTWNYWSAQNHPVLVVLWDQATDRFWWEWCHRFDTSHLDREAADSFAFAFRPEQTWNEQTPGQLLAEVEAWRAWSTPYAHLPITVTVRGKGTVAGIQVGRLVGHLRLRLGQFSSLFAVRSPQPKDGPLRIAVDIDPDKSVIWLSGGPSATLHHGSFDSIPEEAAIATAGFIAAFGGDLMMLIARQLTLMNALEPAARVAGSAVDDATVVHQPKIGISALSLLLSQHKIDEAIRLVTRLLLTGEGITSMIAMVAVTTTELEPDERLRIVSALRNLVTVQAASSSDGYGSHLAYTAAQLMRTVDPEAALEFFDEAARLDPAYRLRSYWWRERGGCLFLSDRFEEAADHYQTALKMGDDRALPALADALMFSGKYRQALDLFDRIRADEVFYPEWRLKSHVLRFLVDLTGIEQQQRDPSSALAHVLEDKGPAHVRTALDLDLLCPLALYGSGVHSAEEGKRSLEFFLAEALVDPLHAHAWLRAIDVALVEQPDMLEDIGTCARRSCGQTMLGVLEEEEAPVETREYVEGLFESIPADPAAPLIFRQVKAGQAEFTSFNVDDIMSDGAQHSPDSQ